MNHPARPRMTGRGEQISDVVHVGDHRWTPGADWATTLASKRDFHLDGHRVPAVTWTLFIDLEPEAWTLLLDPADSIYPTEPPPNRAGQIRFDADRREGPVIETLLFWIPGTRMSGFDLLLSWGRTETGAFSTSRSTSCSRWCGTQRAGPWEWTRVGRTAR